MGVKYETKLTQREAVRRANEKHKRHDRHYLVCHRSGLNEWGISGYFVVARDEKRKWASDETLVYSTEWDDA